MVSKKTAPDSTEGEFMETDQAPKSGFWFGPGSGQGEKVTYLVINDMAICEGDIALGTVQELEQSNDPAFLEKKAAEEQAKNADSLVNIIDLPAAAGFAVGQQYRWPDCTVPYKIDPNLPNPSRVTDAMRHWTEKTGFRFPLRTTQADYIYFTDKGGCWSYIGKRGGEQIISLGSGCTTGNTIHEIGHAIGLFHEQSRNDRNDWVRINWANIDPQYQSNFAQYLNSGHDIGEYDYCSIMHYPRFAFSRNGQETITPLRSGSECMGQRDGLSPKDIAAVKIEYPNCTIPTSCAPLQVKAARCLALYRQTRKKTYLCCYYLNLSQYYCCLYNTTRNPNHLARCRALKEIYIRTCRGIVPPAVGEDISLSVSDPCAEKGLGGMPGEGLLEEELGGGLEEEMMPEEGLLEEELGGGLEELGGMEISEPEVSAASTHRCIRFKHAALKNIRIYRTTRIKKYLCYYYLNLARYNCCLYAATRKRIYLLRCKFYGKLYRVCIR